MQINLQFVLYQGPLTVVSHPTADVLAAGTAFPDYGSTGCQTLVSGCAARTCHCHIQSMTLRDALCWHICRYVGGCGEVVLRWLQFLLMLLMKRLSWSSLAMTTCDTLQSKTYGA